MEILLGPLFVVNVFVKAFFVISYNCGQKEKRARDRAREEIREKISPPLDPVAVSELVVWVLWWRACAPGGQGPPVVGAHLVVCVFWWWAHPWWSESSGGGHVL